MAPAISFTQASRFSEAPEAHLDPAGSATTNTLSAPQSQPRETAVFASTLPRFPEKEAPEGDALDLDPWAPNELSRASRATRSGAPGFATASLGPANPRAMQAAAAVEYAQFECDSDGVHRPGCFFERRGEVGQEDKLHPGLVAQAVQAAPAVPLDTVQQETAAVHRTIDAADAQHTFAPQQGAPTCAPVHETGSPNHPHTSPVEPCGEPTPDASDAYHLESITQARPETGPALKPVEGIVCVGATACEVLHVELAAAIAEAATPHVHQQTAAVHQSDEYVTRQKFTASPACLHSPVPSEAAIHSYRQWLLQKTTTPATQPSRPAIALPAIDQEPVEEYVAEVQNASPLVTRTQEKHERTGCDVCPHIHGDADIVLAAGFGARHSVRCA